MEDCKDEDDGVRESFEEMDVLEGCDLIESSSCEFLLSDPREPR